MKFLCIETGMAFVDEEDNNEENLDEFSQSQLDQSNDT